jgi:hypothetical protein
MRVRVWGVIWTSDILIILSIRDDIVGVAQIVSAFIRTVVLDRTRIGVASAPVAPNVDGVQDHFQAAVTLDSGSVTSPTRLKWSWIASIPAAIGPSTPP